VRESSNQADLSKGREGRRELIKLNLVHQGRRERNGGRKTESSGAQRVGARHSKKGAIRKK